MVRDIVHDNFFLSLKSENATEEDSNIILDMLDTININKDRCVGMAANMIGSLKRILVFLDDDKKYKIMINPIILNKSIPYNTTEGCLSHSGSKECLRYKKIKVSYYDENFKIKIKTYYDFTAEIIQHEMDHFEGILI